MEKTDETPYMVSAVLKRPILRISGRTAGHWKRLELLQMPRTVCTTWNASFVS